MSGATTSAASPLTIGALSKHTGCNIETIRYYEREGLLPNPPRTDGGHRIYAEEHLKRLTFVIPDGLPQFNVCLQGKTAVA